MTEIPPFDPGILDPLWALAHKPKMGDQSYLTRDILEASARYLIPFSDRHKNYSEEDIQRTILPPILNDQALFAFARNPHTNLHQPRGFVTWIYMTPEVEQGYLERTRKIQAKDFEHRSRDSVIWILDMVCPFGAWDVRFLCRQLQDWLSPICRDKGQPAVFARRTDGSIHKFYAVSEERKNKRS